MKGIKISNTKREEVIFIRTRACMHLRTHGHPHKSERERETYNLSNQGGDIHENPD